MAWRSMLAVGLPALFLALALAAAAAGPPGAGSPAAGMPGGGAAQASGEQQPDPEYYPREILPLTRKYCTPCHGETVQIQGVNFLEFPDEKSVIAGRATWEAVLHVLEGHLMPPPAAGEQPTPEEREKLVGWIKAAFARADCEDRTPGRVTLRRLNRAQYNNTVRDLFGIDLRPADDFPSDDVGHGFDNIADVLSLSPLLLEKYLDAAEQIAHAVIVAPEDLAGETRRFPGEELSGENGAARDWYWMLFSNGALPVDVTFPEDGEYVIRVRAFGDQAGPDPARMSVRLDGRQLRQFDVPVEIDAPEIYELRATVEAGRRRLAAAFTNDYYRPDDPDPNNRDRNLAIDYFEVVGPVRAAPDPLPEAHRRFLFCHPNGEEHLGRECARAVLTHFARRAYRRPVTETDVDRLLRAVDLAFAEGESLERGAQLAIQAALISPHFLFMLEPDPPAEEGETVRVLNDHELAVRLSYFVWSSMPDDELFALAERGELREPAALAAQLKRMLADPKAEALVENFALQWLTLRHLDEFEPDPERFPAWDEELRAAALTETRLFFEAVMREDRSVLEFLDADFTFVNERLAKHYGIPGVEGPEFRRVTLTGAAREQRGGVLGQASVLAITSNPTRTSPVQRGKWVLEQLLGTPPPPPPPGVPELEARGAAGEALSLREQTERHTTDPLCASCHRRMDPLGFGLENYDPTGAWRTQDGERPVDPSGELPDGRSFTGPAELRGVLRQDRELFVRNLIENLLTYALGRGLTPGDRCDTEEMAARAAAQDYRFSALAAEVVKSEPFRLKALETGH